MNRVLNQQDFTEVFREALGPEHEYNPQEQVLRVSAEQLPALFALLAHDERLAMDYLRDLTVKEQPAGEYYLVYNWASLAKHRTLMVLAKLPESLEAPTATGYWESANWMEREAYDMFGVRFRGHPDLRRIYLEETVSFFPLRKEFRLHQVVNVGDLGQREAERAAKAHQAKAKGEEGAPQEAAE